jgi:hypothetical protein
MSSSPIINYSVLKDFFDKNLDALTAPTGKPEAGGGEAMSSAELISFISEGMGHLEKAQRNDGLLAAVDNRASSLLQTFFADRLKNAPIVEGANGPEVKFDSHDILGWAGSLFDWLKKLHKHDFIEQVGPVQTIGATHRMALLGDWGTGLYGAPVCKKSIESDGKFDMLLHLGDVYYSGDKDEVQNRFLNVWPKVPGAVSRALNSNHEMYAGGHGYFGMTLPAFGQSASYFAVQNDHWLLVGLDTGYEEHELFGQQVAWLKNLVAQAGERRVILFSHHQPFSLFESNGAKLVKQLAPLLDERKIFAWYWGHEHRCVIYDKHPVWNVQGRCIGHSGFPYFRDALPGPKNDNEHWVQCEGRNLVPSAQVLDGANVYVEDKPSLYGPNGYAVLEFEDKLLTEIIYSANGTELLRTKLG